MWAPKSESPSCFQRFVGAKREHGDRAGGSTLVAPQFSGFRARPSGARRKTRAVQRGLPRPAAVRAARMAAVSVANGAASAKVTTGRAAPAAREERSPARERDSTGAPATRKPGTLRGAPYLARTDRAIRRFRSCTSRRVPRTRPSCAECNAPGSAAGRRFGRPSGHPGRQRCGDRHDCRGQRVIERGISALRSRTSRRAPRTRPSCARRR